MPENFKDKIWNSLGEIQYMLQKQPYGSVSLNKVLWHLTPTSKIKAAICTKSLVFHRGATQIRMEYEEGSLPECFSVFFYPSNGKLKLSDL